MGVEELLLDVPEDDDVEEVDDDVEDPESVLLAAPLVLEVDELEPESLSDFWLRLSLR